MITNCNSSSTYSITAWELRGLSTDEKPTKDEMPNGSSFLEMDTGSVYFWDKTNETWRAV